MSARSIKNGMYPRKIEKLDQSVKDETKPKVTYQQVRQRMRKKLGW